MNADETISVAAKDILITAFTEAIDDPETSERLGRTGTTVRISIRDDPGEVLTLLLDRQPPELHDGDETTVTESSLEIEAVALTGVLDRSVRLAVAVIDGRATYDGPIRKFLRVMPILIAAANHEHFGHSRKVAQ
jgi:hypothetical protein